MLDSHKISHIKQLNPLEESVFLYPAERWKNVPYIDLVKEFENQEISRQDCINAFRDSFEKEDNHIKPFLLTMIWGYANAGYGPFRVKKMLQTSDNIALINDGTQLIKQEKNLELAYQKLNQVQGLGISFFSKILYFASRACGHEHYALIFDIQVARSLVWLTSTNKEVFDMVDIQPLSSWKAYSKYLKYIHEQALAHGIEAEAIEMFLFEGKFK